jgi:hypothetical protein
LAARAKKETSTGAFIWWETSGRTVECTVLPST